jgi:hypothetical protein
MISLTKNPRKVSNVSWLSRPVSASRAAANSPLGRQDVVAFWLAYSFAFDDTGPLPSMFRRKAQVHNAAASAASADRSGDIAAAAGLAIFRVSNVTASYLMAGVLFLFAMVDASLLMTARFPQGEMAVTGPAPANIVTGAGGHSESAEANEAPAIEGAGTGELPKPQWEAGVNASTEEPVQAVGGCVLPQFNCWKRATFIR